MIETFRHASLAGAIVLAWVSTGLAQAAREGTPKKDPIEEAFALPKDAVLSPQQTEAYNKLREEKESPLREALRELENATDQAEKSAAARKLMTIKNEIKAAIAKILKMGEAGSAGTAPAAGDRRPATTQRTTTERKPTTRTHVDRKPTTTKRQPVAKAPKVPKTTTAKRPPAPKRESKLKKPLPNAIGACQPSANPQTNS